MNTSQFPYRSSLELSIISWFTLVERGNSPNIGSRLVAQKKPENYSENNTRAIAASYVAIAAGLTLSLSCFESVAVSAEPASAVTRPLDAGSKYEHVIFPKLPPTEYQLDSGILRAKVDRSASFLFFPFGRALPVTTVEWEWKGASSANLTSAEHEESIEGDDAQLRIGLVLQGHEPSAIPWFLPAWIKQVRASLRPQTTSEMLFLISGGQHIDGQTWSSPHSASITHMAVQGVPGPDEWTRSSVTLTPTKIIVGVWIMADGDDTRARFETQLRNLVLISPREREEEKR